MRITITRSGGFTGIIQEAQAETDTDPDLRGLVQEVDFDALPPSSPAPDRFVYTIDIEGKTAEIGEADLSGPLRELVERVLSS